MSSSSREIASESAFSLFASEHVNILPSLCSWALAHRASKVQAVWQSGSALPNGTSTMLCIVQSYQTMGKYTI